MSLYASFQGRTFLSERDALGLPVNTREPGNATALSLALKTDVLEHYESMSGNRSLDLRLIKQKSANVTLTVEEFTADNLALALYGAKISEQAGTVTAEPLGSAAPVVGTPYFLAHQGISNLVLTDSAATPTTLIDGTHYTADLRFGRVQLLSTTGLTGPIQAAYGYGAVDQIGVFTQPLPERHLRFEGVNTAAGNRPVLLELYRVAFDPLKQLDFISDDLNKFELEGSLLADATKPIDAVLGQFGRIVQIGA